MKTRGLPDCPIKSCKTHGLQRTTNGDLTDGVIAHLLIVHRLGDEEAVRLARLAVAHRYLPGKTPPPGNTPDKTPPTTTPLPSA